MNKKLHLLAALGLFTIGNLSAQTTVFEEGFQNFTTWPDPNWVQHNIDGKTPDPTSNLPTTAFTPTAPWGLLRLNSDPNNTFAASTSWFTVPGQANRWLVTPSIDLSSYSTGIVTLTFKTQSGGTANYLDSYNLYVSTSGTAVSDFGTTFIHQEVGASSGTWTTQTVDLSAYLGQTIHLGWQHTGNDMVMIFLDDIKVVYNAPGSSQDFFKENFTMYPNPTTDVLNITSKNGLNVNEIRISDLTGKVVKVQRDASAINVSDLATGTYLIDITTNEGKATSKFIKK